MKIKTEITVSSKEMVAILQKSVSFQLVPPNCTITKFDSHGYPEKEYLIVLESEEISKGEEEEV